MDVGDISNSNGSRKMNEDQILDIFAQMLNKKDDLHRETKDIDKRLSELCRTYDMVTGTRCIQPHHLRRECERRGFLDRAPSGAREDMPLFGQLCDQVIGRSNQLRGL